MRVIRNLLLAWGVSILGLAALQPASAATITYSVIFGATNFTSPPAAPQPFVLGSLEFTLDPLVASSGSVTVNALNLPFDSPIQFDYNLIGDGTVWIGGTASGVDNSEQGTNDFSLRIDSLKTLVPTVGYFDYTIASSPIAVFMATTSNVIVSPPPVATTPLPAALPLFAAALGGLGFIGWRRRRPVA